MLHVEQAVLIVVDLQGKLARVVDRSQEVLAEAGYTPDDIAALAEAGAVILPQ